MTDLSRCCRHDNRRCIELIEEGIREQCRGLEEFRRDNIRAGREHTCRGLRRVEEGLRCFARRR